MTGYLDWKVGDKLACIDADGSHSLVKGAVYTIGKIGEPSLLMWRGTLRAAIELFLIEAQSVSPRGFAPERFRKVVTRKSDISIFTAMLNTTKKVVDA